MTKAKTLTASQIYYRTVFLKSEEWQTIRLSVLARFDACCYVCKSRSLSNDVHHAFYIPLREQRQNQSNLFVCCRTCHEALHTVYKPISCKIPNSAAWKAFHAAVSKVRLQLDSEAVKQKLNPYMPADNLPRPMRKLLRQVQRQECEYIKQRVASLLRPIPGPPSVKLTVHVTLTLDIPTFVA